MKNKYILVNRKWLYICLLWLMALQGYAQSGSFGNTYIFGGTEMTINGVQHNFLSGGSGILPGTVGTARTSPIGYLSFVGSASWVSASDNAHVDGYVKTYMTGAFTFPIGDNGKYRPAKVSASSLANPTTAAYFGVNPTTAVTSSLGGGNEPVLPTGGPFSSALKATGIQTVSTSEYWDINGATAAQLTLTWDAASNVSAMTSATLSNLRILGWNGSQWVIIPSAYDATSLLGGSSSLAAGSITTTSSIVPDTYSVYTLGSILSSVSSLDCSKTQLVAAPVQGTPGQLVLNVSMNVSTPGTFAPVTVSGSGMTLANGVTSVSTTLTGIQNIAIPLNYDGSTLGAFSFTVGSAGSCSYTLSGTTKKAIVDIWTTDCVPIVGPSLK